MPTFRRLPSSFGHRAPELLESRWMLSGDGVISPDEPADVVSGESKVVESQEIERTPEVARIVGGQSTEQAHGWVASVQNRFGHFCGGTLVSRSTLITAAHCVEGETAESLTVVIGRSHLYEADGQRIAVDSIIAHPAYNAFTNDADIALLQLATESDETPIGFLTPSNARLAAPSNTALVLGWGATREDGPLSPDLQSVRIPIVSNETANEPRAYDGAVTENMLAAGLASGGVDSCQGDSGGPLVVFDGQDQPLLAGVVSWGAGCARPNRYGIYTRVSSFADWILENADVQFPRGTIRFTPTRYLVRSAATLTVEDSDLAEQSWVDVTVSSAAGDVETVRLSAVAPGRFRGTITIVAGSVAPGSSVLDVAGAEQITAIYEDADDGSGNTLNVEAIAAVVVDDFPNDAETTVTLSVDEEIAGFIDVIDDRDWFRFELAPNQGYEIRVALAGGTLDDSVLSLYGDDGETLLAIDDDGGRGLGSQVAYFSAAPKTVFVEVTGYGSNIGSYTLVAEEVEFPADDHFDIFSLATPISLAETVTGEIQYSRDADWFKFEADAGVLFEASVHLNELPDSQLRLVDQDGRTEIAFNDDRSSEDLSSRLHFFVEQPGTYYLEVTAYLDLVGTYELVLTESEDDHGNLPADATPIGEVTTVDFISGEITSFDEDWFSFTAHEGLYYEFTTAFVGSLDELEDSLLQLFDATGERLLAANDDYGNRGLSKIIWQAPADGTYLLQVTGLGGDVGWFDLEYWAMTTEPRDDGGNYPADARFIHPPQSFSRRIDYVADSDWFQLNAIAGSTYAIDITLRDLEDSVLRVWNAEGTTLLEENDDITTEDLSSFIAWTATESGPLYIQVLGYDGHLGGYRLDVSVVGDVTEDGLLNAADMDALFLALAQHNNDLAYDINGDDRVNSKDVDALLRDVLFSQRGDADLNGNVEFADFLALSAHFGSAGGWAQGDFTGDGNVGFDDFLLLSANFGEFISGLRTPLRVL